MRRERTERGERVGRTHLAKVIRDGLFGGGSHGHDGCRSHCSITKCTISGGPARVIVKVAGPSGCGKVNTLRVVAPEVTEGEHGVSGDGSDESSK